MGILGKVVAFLKSVRDFFVKYKDIATTLGGLFQLFIGTYDQYLDTLAGGTFNWTQFTWQVILAFVAYLTGKGYLKVQ
jgi:hypothetical protein